jgi:kynureninase
MFMEVGMDSLRAKSHALDAFARELIHVRCQDRIDILTPADPKSRGCQLSLRVAAGRDAGRAAFERLSAAGVIGDWREPDVIRLAPMPLYTRFADVEIASRILAQAVAAA